MLNRRLRARLRLLLARRGLHLLALSAVLSAGTQLAAGFYADADGVVPWALIAVGVAVAILLALLAWASTEDVKDAHDLIRIKGMTLDEFGRWIGELHTDVQELRRGMNELLAASRSRASE